MDNHMLKGENPNNKAIKRDNSKVKRVLKVPTWDKKKFLNVCADRGYLTERSAIVAVAKALGIARATANRILSSGRIKWEQMLVIGSYFEMTPKEFCDIFLSGFFVEDRNGHFKCHVENPTLLLNPIKVRDYRTKAQRLEEEQERIKEEVAIFGEGAFTDDL